MSDKSKNDYERALTLVSAPKDTIVNASDVDRLKETFVASHLTLEDFCALHQEEVPGVNLKALATRQKWVAERLAFRQENSREARDRLRRQSVEFETKIDAMVHKASKKLVRLISKVLTSTTEMVAKAESEGSEFPRVTLDDLPKMRAGVEALNSAYTLARKTAGLTAEPMPGRDQVNLENLDHDEREQLRGLLMKAAGGKKRRA